ncbi:MAG: hypothetical protein H6Q19_1179 [Bacteroidetes bacterium]|nr:hypothetical protein [Bacteroidota bacterium]
MINDAMKLKSKNIKKNTLLHACKFHPKLYHAYVIKPILSKKRSLLL